MFQMTINIFISVIGVMYAPERMYASRGLLNVQSDSMSPGYSININASVCDATYIMQSWYRYSWSVDIVFKLYWKHPHIATKVISFFTLRPPCQQKGSGVSSFIQCVCVGAAFDYVPSTNKYPHACSPTSITLVDRLVYIISSSGCIDIRVRTA